MALVNGVERYFGNKIDVNTGIILKGEHQIYGDNTKVTPMLTDAQFEDRKIPSYAPPVVYDQKQTNMCNPFSTRYMIESMRRQMGIKPMSVSPGYIYGGINDGVDQGSALEDAMARVCKGYVSTDVVKEFDYDPRHWPNNVAEIAKEHFVTEKWLCPTGRHIMSALHFGFAVVVGMIWGSEDEPDQNGWLADYLQGEPAGGHALCTIAPARKGNRFGFKTPNTWGKGWGINGWCVLPITRFLNGPFTGAWAVRQLNIAKGDLDDLPLPT